jgi:hypothetical protein
MAVVSVNAIVKMARLLLYSDKREQVSSSIQDATVVESVQKHDDLTRTMSL